MEANRPQRNVFLYLFCAMIAFGLSIGIVFPFFAHAIVHSEKVLSTLFFALCIGAGLLVGLVNYLLFYLLISKDLDRIIKGMQAINTDIQNTLRHQVYSDRPCELEVTSNDRLGEVIVAFNSMGRTIDERQRRERQLREAMNTLSDSVDLTFIGQIILGHIPAPPAWQHALLYTLIKGEYHCIAVKNINRDSVAKTLHGKDLAFLAQETPEHFQTMEAQGSCFNSLELFQANVVSSPSHITIAPLFGEGKIIAFIVTACHDYIALTADNEQQCRTYCDHVFPYLRSALLHKKIDELATIDELSRTLNRRAGMRRLQEEYSAIVRHNLALSLIMLDIDHFKKVNDTYGHQAGDMVIRELCNRMLNNLREEDVLFRYGGEEFAIILPYIDQTGAALCAERIRFYIRDKPFDTGQDQDELQVRISLGVVSWPQVQAPDTDTLINLADKALYWAKHHGRDQVAVQTSSEIVSFRQHLDSLDNQADTP